MLGFVQNFFAPRANPIGVDFGSDCLRLAQVQWNGQEHKLIAAASADVPSHVRSSLSARLAFFVETTRDLLAQGNFRGRQAVLALPAAAMHIQHLRMPRLDEQATRKALPFELAGKIPLDPSSAILRHLVAGEVYGDNELKQEVVVMAAARDMVEQLLTAAAKARLDVVGMNVEPTAAIDCFSHIYRRKTDAETTWMLIDIGWSSTRVVIAREGRIHFARSIPIAGEAFARAAAKALNVDHAQAKLLRIRMAIDESESQPQATAPKPSTAVTGAPSPVRMEEEFALLGAALRARGESLPVEPTDPTVCNTTHPPEQRTIIDQAVREPLDRLIEELDLCRRYHETSFPSLPVDRLLFIGGEARHRSLCQHIAQQLSLAAQVGDPLVRMGRISDIGPESGIDRRQPQPAWAIAIGLSMGPKVPVETTV